MAEDTYTHVNIESGAKDAPLVFLFHGTGGDEHQLIELGLAIAPGADLIAPRGDVSESGALRFFRRTDLGVYDMDDLARARAKMAAFVHARRDEHSPSAVIGIGYSNGANILASVLFEAPDLFDGAVLMHPLIPWQPAPQPALAGRSVLITAGERDPICPPPATEALESYLRDQGADVEIRWHPGGHDVHDSEIDAARAFCARTLAIPATA